MIRNVILLTLISTLMMSAAFAGDEGNFDKKHQAKIDDIYKVMELTKSAEMGKMAGQQMLDTMRPSFGMVGPEVWDELAKELDGADFVDMIVPIYDRHLDHKTIKGMIRFYKSAPGAAWIDKQSEILSESMAAGAAWGEQASVRIMTRLMEAQTETSTDENPDD